MTAERELCWPASELVEQDQNCALNVAMAGFAPKDITDDQQNQILHAFAMIEVRILGSRGNIKPTAPRHARHAGVLVGGALLLDCGERSYLKYQPRWTLITHLHPDHAFFLDTAVPNLPAVYAPQTHPRCRARVVKAGEQLRLGEWHVTAIRTVHSTKVLSLAYRVDRSGASLLYTGDLLAIERRYHPLLHTDLIITDGSFIRRGGLVRTDRKSGRRFGHGGIPDLIAFFAPFTRRIVFTHLGAWFYRDPCHARQRVAELGQIYDLDVRLAWDGMRLEL